MKRKNKYISTHAYRNEYFLPRFIYKILLSQVSKEISLSYLLSQMEVEIKNTLQIYQKFISP